MTDCQKEEDVTLPENLLLDEAPKGEKVIIYQMMTRLFGNKNTTNKPYGTLEENGVGKFNDISETALRSLKELGITHVWYTGVIEHAVIRNYQAYGIILDDADVVKGRAGSPYAIKDYYDVNPDLAEKVPERMQEFEQLLARSHEQGLKVIIDFVPNHVARMYTSDAKPEGITDLGENDDPTKSFSPNNNFYYIAGESFKVPEDYNPLGDNEFLTKNGKFVEIPAKATGNDQFTASPSINDWFETVKLNYGVDYQDNRKTYFNPIPDTWLKMTEILKFWASKGVDGFRCDMAEMVPVEFWDYAVSSVKADFPEITFIAEIYNPAAYNDYIQTGRFDFLYDKVQLYDTLKLIMQGKGSTANLTPIWQALRGTNKHMLRFLENHDEQRIASPDFAGSPEKAIPAMVISATWYSGPAMIYFGQEVGEPGAGIEGFGGEDGRTTIFDYWGVPEHQKWMNEGAFDGDELSDAQKELRDSYSKLLNFSKNSEAVAEGKFFDLHSFLKEDANDIAVSSYAYLRLSSDENILVLTNFDAVNTHTISLTIPSSLIELLGKNDFKLEQVFGSPLNTTINNISLGKTVEMTLPPLAAIILKLHPTE